MEKNQESNIIIYNTKDGKTAVHLYTKDGNVWMNQNQLATLFNTSKQNIGQHIFKILEDKELNPNSVVKNYFTTASNGLEVLLKKKIDAKNKVENIFIVKI